MSKIVDYDGVRFVGEGEDIDDEPVSTPMMFMQNENGEEQQERGKEMAAEGEWVPYRGPRGGRGWENTVTGERVYQSVKPGTVGADDEEVAGTATINVGGEPLRAVGLDESGEWDTSGDVTGWPPALNDDDKVRRYDVDNPLYKTYESARYKQDTDGNDYIEFDRSELADIDRDEINDMIEEAANTFNMDKMLESFQEVNEKISTMVHPHVDWDASYPDNEFSFMSPPKLVEVGQLAHKFYNAILDAEEQELLNDVSLIIGSNDPEFKPAVGGWYNPTTGMMFFNVLNANKEFVADAHDEGYSSSPDGISTFWHELAHARHYMNKFTDIDAPTKPLMEYMREFGLAGSQLTLEEQDFAAEHISEYASTSHMEFIAEAVGAAKTDALDLTDEQMRFVLDVFNKYDGPTEMLQ